MAIRKDNILRNNILATFAIRGGALLISIFTMPAYMRYFQNQEILGVWFTILSVLSWFFSFDLGIGNGLRNKLVISIAKNAKDEIAGYITSSYYLITLLSIIITGIGLFAIHSVNWNNLLNISVYVISKKTLSWVVSVLFIGIMLQFVLRIISSILFALQKAAWNNFISLVTSVLQLIFVLFAPSYSPEENIQFLSYAYIVFSSLPLIVTTFLVFSYYLRDVSMGIKSIKSVYIKDVFALGGVFFWNQLVFILIINTNDIFVARLMGPAAVVEYQIYNKLFSIIGMLFTLALTPVWSAITKAFAENDKVWLHKHYTFLKYIGYLAGASQFLIVPFLQIIVNIWLGGNAIKINSAYALVFACFSFVFTYQTILSTFVCGIGKLKNQAFFYSTGLALKILFLLVFRSFFLNSWIIVIIVNIMVFSPYCVSEQINLDRMLKPEVIESK